MVRRASRMRRKARQWTVFAVGWMFILLGLVQLFLPLFQGWIFILGGLVLLSVVSPRARLVILRIRRRWPRTGARIDSTRRRANRVLTRMFGG